MGEKIKFIKNKNVDPNVYITMAIDSGVKLPCAVDEQNVSINKKEIVGTITTDGSSAKKNNRIMESSYRIRKLTPRECFRLMGFSDSDFDKAKEAGISNSQLYKQAGNSIVVDVLYCIFTELYQAMPYLFDDLRVSSYFSGIGAFEKGLDRLFSDINKLQSDKPSIDRLDKGETIIYDDYNSRVRMDQNTIETLSTTVGHSALRNSYKIIEKIDEMK